MRGRSSLFVRMLVCVYDKKEGINMEGKDLLKSSRGMMKTRQQHTGMNTRDYQC